MGPKLGPGVRAAGEFETDGEAAINGDPITTVGRGREPGADVIALEIALTPSNAARTMIAIRVHVTTGRRETAGPAGPAGTGRSTADADREGAGSCGQITRCDGGSGSGGGGAASGGGHCGAGGQIGVVGSGSGGAFESAASAGLPIASSSKSRPHRPQNRKYPVRRVPQCGQ